MHPIVRFSGVPASTVIGARWTLCAGTRPSTGTLCVAADSPQLDRGTLAIVTGRSILRLKTWL